MKKIISNPETAIKLTIEEAKQLGIDPTQDQQSGEIKTFGPWGIVQSFKALAISAKYTKEYYTKCTELTIYGVRTLSDVKQAGYNLEGRTSIEGRKYSAFSSSQLFEIDGKLIEVATIHARIK